MNRVKLILTLVVMLSTYSLAQPTPPINVTDDKSWPSWKEPFRLAISKLEDNSLGATLQRELEDYRKGGFELKNARNISACFEYYLIGLNSNAIKPVENAFKAGEIYEILTRLMREDRGATPRVIYAMYVQIFREPNMPLPTVKEVKKISYKLPDGTTGESNVTVYNEDVAKVQRVSALLNDGLIVESENPLSMLYRARSEGTPGKRRLLLVQSWKAGGKRAFGPEIQNLLKQTISFDADQAVSSEEKEILSENFSSIWTKVFIRSSLIPCNAVALTRAKTSKP